MAIAPPTATRIRSAAARKIFSRSENRGGAGGGSFKPTRTGGPVSVAPGASRALVALIVRPGAGRVVFAVLVFVGLRLETGRVQANGHGRFSRADRQRRRRHFRLFVPHPEGEGAGRDAFERSEEHTSELQSPR